MSYKILKVRNALDTYLLWTPESVYPIERRVQGQTSSSSFIQPSLSRISCSHSWQQLWHHYQGLVLCLSSLIVGIGLLSRCWQILLLFINRYYQEFALRLMSLLIHTLGRPLKFLKFGIENIPNWVLPVRSLLNKQLFQTLFLCGYTDIYVFWVMSGMNSALSCTLLSISTWSLIRWKNIYNVLKTYKWIAASIICTHRYFYVPLLG